MDDRDKAIKKIRGLLALAQDAAATPNEREQAIKIAQALRDKFDVQEWEVTAPLSPDEQEYTKEEISTILEEELLKIVENILPFVTQWMKW